MRTRQALLTDAIERLRMARVDTPELDARVLLKEALKLTDAELIGAADHPASLDGASVLESMITRRVGGEPVARILGHREFWSMRFDLGCETLVPRPETETLVETALAAFRRAPPGPCARSGHRHGMSADCCAARISRGDRRRSGSLATRGDDRKGQCGPAGICPSRAVSGVGLGRRRRGRLSISC